MPAFNGFTPEGVVCENASECGGAHEFRPGGVSASVDAVPRQYPEQGQPEDLDV
jgi:hypothetical protein